MKDYVRTGRGATSNETGRFEKQRIEMEEEYENPKTIFYRDTTKKILTTNDSPDLGFSTSINPYRGCEHGCIYCYARPTHEYLGYSAGVDFETKILVKENAPTLLRKELLSVHYKPQVIVMSGVTDCYQPAEKRFRLTRGCVEVFGEFKNPFVIITKNHLVTRDIDILVPLATQNLVLVCVSITSLDSKLCKVMEPRTSRPHLRLQTVKELSAAGIPVNVNVAPVISGLTDHEMPDILEAARDAGAISAMFTVVRLPYSVKDLFVQWLEQHYPNKKNKVLNRIRSMRGGQLYKAEFGSRMRGEGEFSDLIKSIFVRTCKKLGLNERKMSLTTEHFQRPGGQLDLPLL